MSGTPLRRMVLDQMALGKFALGRKIWLNCPDTELHREKSSKFEHIIKLNQYLLVVNCRKLFRMELSNGIDASALELCNGDLRYL